jgi:predicted nucleic-acid-binding Zn-ribbon protein
MSRLRHLSRKHLNKDMRKKYSRIIAKGNKLSKSIKLDKRTHYAVYCKEKCLFFGVNSDITRLLDGQDTFCNNLDFLNLTMGNCYIYDVRKKSILNGDELSLYKEIKGEDSWGYGYFNNFLYYHNIATRHLALAIYLMPCCNWELMSKKKLKKKYIDNA